MKLITSIVVLALSMAVSVDAFSASRVRGYTKKDGAYVQPHYKTTPNKTRKDNYGAKGNYNPYTGKTGTKEVKPKKTY